jgi:uncharacterized low-complexity protein
MMNNKITSRSALIGAAFVASASLSPMACASDATFTATPLTTGYTLADNSDKADAEHKCGEGKCAAEHKNAGDANKANSAEKKAEGEHKCGEGKCGADKEAVTDTANNTADAKKAE